MSGVTLYSEMSPEVASVAQAAAERIRVRISRTAQDIIEIGRDLTAVKAELGHGRFLPWLEAEFGMSDETARKFMLVAKNVGDKIQPSWDLPASVLYALAAPSAEPIREEAIRRVEAGEPVNMDVIADLKRQLVDAKQAAKDAKRDEKAQKEAARLANEDRARILRDYEWAKSKADSQAVEIERLKQDGVIHVYPSEPAPPQSAAVHSLPSKAGMLRTAAELIADRFDRDVAELSALLREAGLYSLAGELEAVAQGAAA